MAELFALAGSRRVHADRVRRSGIDLSRTAWDVLARVERYGPVSVTRLAEQTGLSLASTSRTLRDLATQGLVERAADPADGRVARFACTRDGRAVGRRFRAAIEAELVAVLDQWSGRDRDRFARDLARLVEDMRSVEGL